MWPNNSDKSYSTLVLPSQQPEAELLQTGLKGRKFMEGPTSHKGSTAVKGVKKMERNGKQHKIYSPFSEEESIHVTVEGYKGKNQR